MIARVLTWASVLLVATIAWEIAASYLFIWFGGLFGALDFPAIAWLTYASNPASTNTKILLWFSGGVPFAIEVVAAVVICRHAFKPTRRPEIKEKPLYGDSRIANERDLTNNNFVLK